MKNKKKSPSTASAGSDAEVPRSNSFRGLVRRTLGDADLRSLTAGFSSMKGVFSRRASMPNDVGRTNGSEGGGGGGDGGSGSGTEAEGLKEDRAAAVGAPATTTATTTTATTATTTTTTTTSATAALLSVFRTSSNASDTEPQKAEGSSMTVTWAEGKKDEIVAVTTLREESTSSSSSSSTSQKHSSEGGSQQQGDQAQDEELNQSQPAKESEAGGLSFLAAAAGGAAASLTSLMTSSSPNPLLARRRGSSGRSISTSSAGEKRPATGTTAAAIMELAQEEDITVTTGVGEHQHQHQHLQDGAEVPGAYDGTQTLSRNHPIFELIRQRSKLVSKTEDFNDDSSPLKQEAGLGTSGGNAAGGGGGGGEGGGSSTEAGRALPGPTTVGHENGLLVGGGGGGGGRGGGGDKAAVAQEERYTPFQPRKKTDYEYAYVDKLVLKFTTYSQNNEESAFVIGKSGGTIGRDTSNTVSVPSDTTLMQNGHALIGHKNGCFYLKNQGTTHCAAIRIGSEPGLRDWPLDLGATFSVGMTIFVVKDLANGELVTDITDGPLQGERRIVGKKGATLGRSPDNTLSIADPELSRRHSRIEYDEKDGKYYLSDVGSTNGTYMQLAGPYTKIFHLSLGDQIMVGRTGFSVNRYDYGISEERGRRKTMEDHTLVIQDLGVRSLKRFGLAPQTFAAVFDGHGGEEASAYLSRHLHVNLRKALERSFAAVPTTQRLSTDEVDSKVKEAAAKAFKKTDEDFLNKGNVDAGSTATTVLIMGRRVYSCNVGDSRTIISREQSLLLCSSDHKPAREDEARRIREAGGFIFQNRVMGELAVSRAFGDRELKKCMQEIMAPEELEQMNLRDAKSEAEEGLVKDYSQPLVIARPEFIVSELTDKDDFILLACDGLFDVFPNSEVVHFVLEEMKQHHDSQRACENLSYTAIHQRIAHDNVSIVLLVMNKWW